MKTIDVSLEDYELEEYACELNDENISSEDLEANVFGYVNSLEEENWRNYLTSYSKGHLITKVLSEIRKLNKKNPKNSNIGLIRNLYVSEELRNLGIGYQLMNECISEMLCYTNTIILISDGDEDNSFNLTKWYEDLGFKSLEVASTSPLMILSVIS